MMQLILKSFREGLEKELFKKMQTEYQTVRTPIRLSLCMENVVSEMLSCYGISFLFQLRV